MAILKSRNTKFGENVKAEYWNIAYFEGVQSGKKFKIQVKMEGFSSNKDRRNGGKPLDVYRFSFTLRKKDVLSFETIYNSIKLIEEFADAIDILEEEDVKIEETTEIIEDAEIVE